MHYSVMCRDTVRAASRIVHPQTAPVHSHLSRTPRPTQAPEGE